MKREWKKIEAFDFKEILFEEYQGIAKITINRPRYRNAFTPRTTWEMSQAFAYCRETQDIGVVLLTGAGDMAFCAGGDMNVKGRGGYVGEDGVPSVADTCFILYATSPLLVKTPSSDKQVQGLVRSMLALGLRT